MEENILKVLGKEAKITNHKYNTVYVDYSPKRGRGEIMVYDIFPGIQIMVSDFESDSCYRKVEKQHVMEIIHCKQGCFECIFNNQEIFYMGEGDVAINSMEHMPISSSFPTKYYYGASIMINPNEVQSSKILNEFSIDLQKIYSKYYLNKNCYIYKKNKKLNLIYDELYESLDFYKMGFFRLKTIELLYYLQENDLVLDDENTYLSPYIIEIIKNIRESMIKDLDKKRKLESIVKGHRISMTQFKQYFKIIYGQSPYAYIRRYKMDMASRKLIETDMKISEIALELSYTNASKFSHAFYNEKGMSPKEYRLAYKKTRPFRG